MNLLQPIHKKFLRNVVFAVAVFKGKIKFVLWAEIFQAVSSGGTSILVCASTLSKNIYGDILSELLDVPHSVIFYRNAIWNQSHG